MAAGKGSPVGTVDPVVLYVSRVYLWRDGVLKCWGDCFRLFTTTLFLTALPTGSSLAT